MDQAPANETPGLSAPTDAADRAPLAVATSIAVMLIGAAFLVFVISRTPEEIVSKADSTADADRAAAGESADPMVVAEAGPDAAAIVIDDAETAIVADVALGEDEDLPARSAEDGPLPRLKPAPAETEAARSAVAAASVMALGQLFAASDDDRPASFFFASDIVRDERGRAPLAVAYAGDVNDGPRRQIISLEKGENFVDAMRRAGVRTADSNAAAYAFGAHQNLRALLPGQEFVLTTGDPNQTIFQMAANDRDPQSYLLSLEYKPDATNRITLKRARDGGFTAEKTTVALTSRLVSINGKIGGSLFMSAKHAGASDQVIADFANIFAYDVDFQREIFGGDEFEAIFENRYDENGAMVGAGDILFARLKWRGRTREKGYYRFAADGARADYYDATGQSAKRLLMKTPIDGARLSSGFGTRKHPILGYAKAHKGVDFAAPRGTPVKAAGDGVIERANRYGSFGNYVRIRHANGYETAYAHLNGFARGIRAGKRVRQGDIIAYVGTTGRSTGPHLHYEVHLKGQPVNPQRLKIATGIELKGPELQRFKAERDRIDAMRLAPAPQTPALLAQDGDDGAQL
jgi:murein DD-endopeptidase MepM/ murein hydrolase activator NlpD